MNHLFKLALVAGTLALSVLLSLNTFQPSSARSQTAGSEAFPAERAMKHVETIARNTHPVGSPEQKEAREYIVDALKTLGLKPEVQRGHGENDEQGFMGLVPYSGELENIYARLKGSGNTNQSILMLAHYDSTLGGPGAADDVSGVAVLLETARALSKTPLRNDIVFLFTDGEEAGLLGSKLFADNSGALNDVCLVMNFESRGYKDSSILFETSDGNGWLMKEFKKAVPYHPMAYSFTSDIYKMVSNITDFTTFKSAGKSGFNFSNLGGMEVYHNPQDTAENLDPGFLQHQGTYALSLAKHFGNIALDNVKSDHNAVYFTLTKSLMVLYPEEWTVPLTILSLILFLVTLWIGLRKRLLSLRGIITGFLASLLMIAAAAGFGIIAQTVFLKIYYKLENVLSLSDLVNLRRTIVLQGNTWMIISLILSFVILFILQRLLANKIAGYNLLFGNLVTWLILTVFSTICLPGAGYIFLWPLIVSLAALLIEFLIGRVTGPQNLILFLFSTFTCVLIYVPVAYLLFQALTMMGAGIPIAVLSLPAGVVLFTASLFIGGEKTTVAGVEYKNV